MSWRYDSPHGSLLTESWTIVQDAIKAGEVETLGRRELALMRQARGTRGGKLVLSHDRAGNAQRMAARRLVLRGLLTEPYYLGGGHQSWRAGRNRPMHLYVYELTQRGRECWLRARSDAGTSDTAKEA